MIQLRPRCFAALFALFSVAACGGGGGDSFNGSIEIDADRPEICDPIDPRHCLLPFPSDTFTQPDESTDTGLLIRLPSEGTPTNQAGVQIDTTEWNRNDGFSPGSQVMTYVAGIDLGRTGAAPITDIASSLREDAPIVVLDVDANERLPYFVELDATVTSDADRVLFVRPARNLREGHRHIVAFRNLRDASGTAIAASDVFRAYRDRLRTNVQAIEDRRERFERVFTDLEANGVSRDETLYLAWDFTVASERNLSERVLRMRDDAFASLGDASPGFTITEVEENVDERVARRITGTFQVPLYLTEGGGPGTRLSYGADGLPARNGDYTADFRCIIPHASLAGENGAAVPARPSVYGHGLLGSEREVSAGNVRSMANEHNFVFCATKWIGMSEEDIGNAIAILGELGRFPTLADRLQQGMLNTLFLGRLMIHSQGLSSHAAFQGSDGQPVIDRNELFYDGNSQGGIMGGAVTAIATDWTRAVLGVPGMNYSVLLHRSVDWDTYNAIYQPAYPDELERTLGLNLIQMLWDRGEANGYALHLTDDPLPGTPAHKVLMHVAFGDHQVSQTTAEIQARTIGAHVHTPAVTPGRLADVTPFWGIPPVEGNRYDGSAIVIWDSGAAAPPLTNLPPREGEDPHEDPRADPEARVQKSEFLKPDGAVVDVCNDAPCMADPA